MSVISIPISPTKTSPTKAITKIAPQVELNIKKCHSIINIGLFFDGTNNNKDRDTSGMADTNISRLYDVYRDATKEGYYRYYMPGVGTKFLEIGEYFENEAGAGCAFGCEARVIFALLTIINALHSHCFADGMFDSGAVLALCRNEENVPDDSDCENLAKLGLEHGLLQPSIGSNSTRHKFLKEQTDRLKAKFETGKPRIVECFIDVFGFSRGAAQARVFCNWLNELLVGGRFAGVPLHFRFVGIMDTVASAGFWSGATALVKNSTGGHGAWASADSMRIPTSVKNCVHMVAMHELRRNFPLDQIGTNGKLQQGWVQHVYPGAHSDIGGGYKPGALGIAIGDDSMKLSQIPLNHMLDCAIAAGVPMNRTRHTVGRYDPLAIHPDLAKAYADFISHSKLAPLPIYEWLQPYLNWRWQIREQFHTTNQVKRANQADREVLLAFNKRLINDAAAITRPSTATGNKSSFSVRKFFSGMKRDFVINALMEPEARSVLATAQRAAPTPPAYAALFDGYVHDSLAGFNKPNLEITGYWRYRRVFLGNDDHTVASNADSDKARNVA